MILLSFGRWPNPLRLWGLVCLTLLATGCPRQPGERDKSTNSDSNQPLTIVVTTGMVGDLVRNVAGDRANVIGLMGEGIDPHLYRPTGQDIKQLRGADIVFYSGLLLEGRLQSALEKAAKEGQLVQAVTDALPKDVLRFPAAFEGHPDPHVWGDAALWAQCLDPVVEVLSKKDPEHAADYTARAAKYREELLAVDRYARDSIASIPKESRYLVTAHDAFSYFSRAYDIEERSVQGITTESEAGTRDINELVAFLVANKVPALFVEATVNSKNLQAVIEGAKHQGWTVKIGGMLFSDSMGAAGTYEGTYIGMMDHNVTTITRALGGTAPERGMNGKLTPAK